MHRACLRRIGVALVLAANVGFGQVLPVQLGDAQLLADNGLEPTRESLAKFLGQMFPGDGVIARIQFLAKQLDDPSPDVRDAAMRELADMGPAPLPTLEPLLDSPIPEVRRRARDLVESARKMLDAGLLHAVFRTIRTEKIDGMTPLILQAIPLAGEPFLREQATLALLAVAHKRDVKILVRAAEVGSPDVRIAAFRALGRVDPKAAIQAYKDALTAPSARVRGVAARRLTQLGNREGLPVLVALMDDPDLNARALAHTTLRSVAGTNHSIVPSGQLADRAEIKRRWNVWLKKNGATIEWKTPLLFHDVIHGRTLIALYGKHRVIELDASGRQVWELNSVKNPWAVWGMPNGHRLITHYTKNKVVEYDVSGAPVWTSKKLPGTISSVASMRNGNVLVAIGYSRPELLVIDRESNKTRVIQVKGQPVCAVELPDGNFLVTLNAEGAVVTMDRSGKEIRRITGLRGPYNARSLPNGNILVSENTGKRISEWTQDGKKVWEKASIERLYTTARLEDGSTLFSDDKGLRKVKPDGTVTTIYSYLNDYLYFHRY